MSGIDHMPGDSATITAWRQRFAILASFLASFLAACVGACPPAAAQQGVPSRGGITMLVLDGSNSMNGRLAGETAFKHVMVREAIRSALPKLPRGEVGLASFGHRRPGDCTDADVLQPPTADLDRVLAPLERFQPKGFSPVALAMRTAARALPAGNAKSSMVLVLDDLASCRAEDPCKVAGDLKRDMPGLTIHVVGLALKSTDAQIMACVARQTGGRLFDAQDGPAASAAIADALTLAAASDVPQPRPAAPPAKDPGKAAQSKGSAGPPPAAQPAVQIDPRAEAEKKPGVHLSARLAEGGPRLEHSMRWIVRKTGAAAGDIVAEASQPFYSIALPNGRYSVEVHAELVKLTQEIEVTSPGPMPVRMVLNAGMLSLTAPLSKGAGPSRRALLAVYGGGAVSSRPLWIAHAGADDVVVPAGSYRIVAEDGLAKAEQSVTLAAGQRREVEVVLGAGRLVVDATQGSGEPLSDGVQFVVEEDDPDSPTGKREVVRSAAPRLDVTLPAGSYQVTARRGVTEARERIPVKAGEDTSRSILLASARVRLSSRLGAQTQQGVTTTWRIERLETPPRTFTRAGTGDQVLELTPGRYRFEARLGMQNAVAAVEAELRPGTDQVIEMPMGAGAVRLKLSPSLSQASGGLGFGEVFWQIVDEGGQTVWRTSQLEPALVLAAGRYTVVIELKERTLERQLDVRAGDNRLVEVSG